MTLCHIVIYFKVLSWYMPKETK